MRSTAGCFRSLSSKSAFLLMCSFISGLSPTVRLNEAFDLLHHLCKQGDSMSFSLFIDTWGLAKALWKSMERLWSAVVDFESCFETWNKDDSGKGIHFWAEKEWIIHPYFVLVSWWLTFKHRTEHRPHDVYMLWSVLINICYKKKIGILIK